MKEFKPDFSEIQAGNSSEFARKTLIEFVRQYALWKGLTHQDIANKTGMHRSNVTRILSSRYSPELDSFLKIAGALNLHLDLQVKVP